MRMDEPGVHGWPQVPRQAWQPKMVDIAASERPDKDRSG